MRRIGWNDLGWLAGRCVGVLLHDMLVKAASNLKCLMASLMNGQLLFSCLPGLAAGLSRDLGVVMGAGWMVARGEERGPSWYRMSQSGQFLSCQLP